MSVASSSVSPSSTTSAVAVSAVVAARVCPPAMRTEEALPVPKLTAANVHLQLMRSSEKLSPREQARLRDLLTADANRMAQKTMEQQDMARLAIDRANAVITTLRDINNELALGNICLRSELDALKLTLSSMQSSSS